MAERPMFNEDDDLFNYQPLAWIDQHRKLFRDAFWCYAMRFKDHEKSVIRLDIQGIGVAISLHANGTWTLEDTTGG